MAGPASRTIRRAFTWGVILAALCGLAYWWRTKPRLPERVVIATGESGGMYHRLGVRISHLMTPRLGRLVETASTAGSDVNAKMLERGQAHLAIEQGGVSTLYRQAVVTPLYPEYVFVLVRRDRGVDSLRDLKGRRVSIGRPGSGMRDTARRMLQYFELSPDAMECDETYFAQMLDDARIDAAIVTTGAENPDLWRLLADGDFELLPIPNTAAIAMRDAYFQETTIPIGAFAHEPPQPTRELRTLTTTAFLVATADAPDALVEAALAAVHEDNLRVHAPTLIPRDEASRRVVDRLHPAARRYFHPGDQLGDVANALESVAAGKELIFALGAGCYLLWQRYRRLREKENEHMVRAQKEHLDTLLQETLKIEAQLMTETNPKRLQVLLEKVTRIKMKALQEFTDEQLRADSAFSILLDQCGLVMQGLREQIAMERDA